jgi:hypothetical protein
VQNFGEKRKAGDITIYYLNGVVDIQQTYGALVRAPA